VAKLQQCPEDYIFGLDIGTRSIVGTVGRREDEKHFRVIRQVIKTHDTRAMLDGQIHDIDRVAETISAVKVELEQELGYKLEKVCIAAAGRVLKTVVVRADLDLGEEKKIDDELLHNLELTGMELAYQKMKDGLTADINMHCVGYTIVHYYLDDYLMLSMEGHKGRKISADFLATFLPDEVVDSLYVAVEKADLEVANLTLEPIAASEVAIPKNFRLLNIALVDVGAGTSDICITDEGTIIGYGMIPTAGDAFTEIIAQKCLVDFNAAEKIKIDSFSKKTVSYKDIMGISHKVPAKEIQEMVSDKISESTKMIADKIIELNNGEPVSAVFVVGGGGKLPEFPLKLAEHLGVQKERVAVRGKEVLGNIIFDQDNVSLDSTLVTPIGICLSYLEKNNSFIMVSVNGRQIKIYDNNRLTVMDAAIQIGFPKDNIFPRRGKELIYYVNNETRMVRGEAGEAANISVNGKHENFTTKIEANDVIEIIPSTAGADATATIGEIAEFKRKGNIEIEVNGKKIVCPKIVLLNGNFALESMEIAENDHITVLEYYTLEQVLRMIDMPQPTYFALNDKEADAEDRIYDGCRLTLEWEENENTKTMDDVLKEAEDASSDNQEEQTDETSNSKVQEDITEKEKTSSESSTEESKTKSLKSKKKEETSEQKKSQSGTSIQITVNGDSVTLSNKKKYVVVDILDVYPFDITKAKEATLVLLVNGMTADFTSDVKQGDSVELKWKAKD